MCDPVADIDFPHLHIPGTWRLSFRAEFGIVVFDVVGMVQREAPAVSPSLAGKE